MKLYSGQLSLFARKVEIALLEKGLPFSREFVPFSQAKGYNPKHPAVLAANPKGQVPVLFDAELAIYDSTVIFEYLEDIKPEPPLYPRSPQARARCRLLEMFADEIMIVALRHLMHRNAPRPNEPALWREWEDRARAAETQLATHFRHLDQELAEDTFLCGTFSVADIAMFMVVHYARRLGGPGLADSTRLAQWYDMLAARPAFAQTISEIAAADLELSQPVPNAFRA